MTSVLLAAKHTPDGRCKVGGVQTWIDTVRTELQKRGYECSTWAWREPIPTRRFDFGIFAHLMHTEPLLGLCDRQLAIAHGVVGVENVPSGSYLRGFTSEEVARSCGAVEPIIRQPIDLDFWKPGPCQYKLAPGNFVHYGYRSPVDCHGAAASLLGLRSYHLKRNTKAVIRDILRQAEVVMATGRAACEAMACGARVVICDNRSTYQGPLLDPDTVGAMTRNYSGRGGAEPNAYTLAEAAKAAIARGPMRAHAEQHHDVRKITDQILALLEGK